jgi:hypothetical protein
MLLSLSLCLCLFLQYYVGAESPKYEYDAAAQADKKETAYAAPSDNSGSYTFVLQGASHY